MNSDRKKLLFISGISPFPTLSGGASRTLNTLKYLSEHFDIVLYTFLPQGYSYNESEQRTLNEYCLHVLTYPLPEDRTLQSFVFNGTPYWFSNWYADEALIIAQHLIKRFKIDFVQIDFTQVAYLESAVPSQIPTVFVSHDISTVSFYRRLSEVSILQQPLHFFRLLEIFLYEHYWLPRFDLIVPVSEHDNTILKREFNIKNTFVCKNGIDSIELKTRHNVNPKLKIKLGYIGSFTHPPNKSSFIYFIQHIAPLLKAGDIPYTFYLAGDNDLQEIRHYIDTYNPGFEEHLVHLGKVEEIKTFFHDIDLMIAPIRSGSGTRVKILDALRFGTPTITTSIGAEGIDGDFGDYLKVVDSPIDFVNAVRKYRDGNYSNLSHEILIESLKPYLWSTIWSRYAIFVNKLFFNR